MNGELTERVTHDAWVGLCESLVGVCVSRCLCLCVCALCGEILVVAMVVVRVVGVGWKEVVVGEVEQGWG